MYKNDLVKELSQNFIEYAVAVNTDRSIPSAVDGLKPVARRIIYSAYDNGRAYSKPHVKCANIVGEVMGQLHPHGDSSIYGAMVRLAQPWVMRYPLIDWHGSMGNIAGDGPAAYRYTEARLAKLSEDGLLSGIKKNNVDFMPNYDETREEPIILPAIFPNLLCNPNAGIGVAMACSWGCHNLNEVAQAIYDYLDGKEPMLPGPDFPTGGIIINANDIPNIMKTGRGTVKIRGKHEFDGNKIIFTEIPYGTTIEALLKEVGDLCDANEINGIKDIRDESNKKGIRIVIECDKTASMSVILNSLFQKTNLQSSFSYNQVALIDKTPTELNLKDCIKIYIENNLNCIRREAEFDKAKAQDRLEILDGLLKALESIDNIITLIKKSASAAAAKTALMSEYGFTEPQAKAIVDMKLGRLAGLEKLELQNEYSELNNTLKSLNALLNSEDNQKAELVKRLQEIVKKYGDARRTILMNLEIPKEEKEIAYVEPEKCVVVLTESGLIKRVPVTAFKIQKRAGKGVKTQDDITSTIIRTNTVDNLMIFTNLGVMHRLLVDNIPVGNNTSKGVPVSSLIEFAPGEEVSTIYSIYRDTDAAYVLFATKNGMIKKTPLEDLTKTKKRSGLPVITFKDNDALANVSLVKDEELIILTKRGMGIHFNSNEVTPTGRSAMGVKSINLNEDDEVLTCLPIRNKGDNLAIFTDNGLGKQIKISELPLQKRGGKGLAVGKDVKLAAACLVEGNDLVLVGGDRKSICITASDITEASRTASGTIVIKDSNIKSVSKV